jgi:hypothetical protein
VIRVATISFCASNFSNDIALLQLQQPLHLDGKHIAPYVCRSSTAMVSLSQPGQQYSNGESVSARTAVQQW